MNRLLEFEHIRSLIQHAPQLLVVSDYDGTLAPIAATPELACLSERAYRAVSSLSRIPQVTMAVISGRSLRDVRDKVALDIIYGGNHGAEIHGGGIDFLHPGVAKSHEALSELSRRLQAGLKRWHGAWVEDKQWTATVHVRAVAPQKWPAVFRYVAEVVGDLGDGFRLRPGNAALEILPVVDWHKGAAVRYIRKLLGLENALVICLGDDPTDETMFEAIDNGITIHVGSNPQTAAEFTLPDVDAVICLMERIACELKVTDSASDVWRVPRFGCDRKAAKSPAH